MRLESIKGLAVTTVAAGLILYTACVSPTLGGDEPGLLGRLFRNGSQAPDSTSKPGSASNPMSTPTTPSASPPIQDFYGKPALSTPPSTAPGSAPAPRVTPKPRVNKAMTEADPLVSRISLGRSDNGSQFAMLLEVFADGTVIDTEGVHKVSPDVLKPVVEAVSSGELAKLKGYCGGPAGDFIENVHVVVYERSMGRLRANSFSYSGNPQGCDHAVRHLQKVLDTLQTKIAPSSPVASAPAMPGEPAMPLTTTR